MDADQPAKFVVNGTAVEETTVDAMKDGVKVGTYTLDSLTGEVTFTPNKDFVGTPDAVTVQVKDENGTTATAKYTPTVTPVTPTGEDVTSTGKQGKVQTGIPKFYRGRRGSSVESRLRPTSEICRKWNGSGRYND